MFEDFFIERLTSLRNQKNVSAREMSLALGQNDSYINRIENRLTFPSMQVFFYICEYFQITPQEFFDENNPAPGKINQITKEAKKLDDFQLDTVMTVIKGLQHKTK
ncbi:MAG: helix-turn-helix transcriptional regulator [Lachnospiraceae bacterium]|nr:helix-turn-helix transcriptional regulator [Lachnospiraceae bacterium]